jgi:acyl carrier protein
MSARTVVLSIIARVAPNADLDGLRGDENLRDELDLDSMDFLNILIAIAQELGVEVPERDYGSVRTLDDLVDYVELHRDPTA